MTINEKRGILEFNTAELDIKTLELCRAYLRDALRRQEITAPLAKTKKASAEGELQRQGLRHACALVEVLKEHAKGNDRTIEIFNK